MVSMRQLLLLLQISRLILGQMRMSNCSILIRLIILKQCNCSHSHQTNCIAAHFCLPILSPLFSTTCKEAEQKLTPSKRRQNNHNKISVISPKLWFTVLFLHPVKKYPLRGMVSSTRLRLGRRGEHPQQIKQKEIACLTHSCPTSPILANTQRWGETFIQAAGL